MKKIVSISFVGLLAAAVVFGCGGAQKIDAEKPGQPQQEAPVVAPASLVEARLDYLPADSQFVGLVRAEYLWKAALEFMPKGSTVDDFKPLKESLSDIYSPGPETNFFEADHAIFAITPKSLTVIFEGDFAAPENLPSTRVGRQTVYDLDDFWESISGESPTSTDVYLTFVEDQTAVLHVVFVVPTERENWPASIEPWSSDKISALDALLKLSPPSGAVGVNLDPGPVHQLAQRKLSKFFGLSEFSLPVQFVVGLGDRISIGARGQGQEISSFEEQLDGFSKLATKLVEKAGAPDPDASVKKKIFGASFHTFIGAHVRNIEKEKFTDSVLFSIPAPRGAFATLIYFEEFDSWARKAQRRFSESTRGPSNDSDGPDFRRKLKVVKAAENIEAGEILRESMFQIEDVPVQFLPPNPLLAMDLNIYVGVKFAVDVQKGNMILTSDFVEPESAEE